METGDDFCIGRLSGVGAAPKRDEKTDHFNESLIKAARSWFDLSKLANRQVFATLKPQTLGLVVSLLISSDTFLGCPLLLSKIVT